ncbi:hypothetical protein [Streptomyces sp. ITFR-6]|uniref:hypothetical protein n=1 Tax=Streptomyces sp. ITFR-6 TaxID=3075197 RepID=UPI00288B0E9A|nr:hypothetical protein [Streptomyces sp. ITFR-6]WNI28645.1 hypothetical protein RLT59_07465 [Streptomyces sp. ITFR-6]
MSRGAGPLSWRTSGGFTPELVRQAHTMFSFPKGGVVDMLDAADEAHREALYAENDRGGEARQVVADVALILGTDIDAGPGHRWDADHMQRVVTSAYAVDDERNELAAEKVKLTDLLRAEGERANAAIAREEASDEAAAEMGDYVRQLERERDELRAAIVSQAREIARLKGESA